MLSGLCRRFWPLSVPQRSCTVGANHKSCGFAALLAGVYGADLCRTNSLLLQQVEPN